jgi:hypothetical protein
MHCKNFVADILFFSSR